MRNVGTMPTPDFAVINLILNQLEPSIKFHGTSKDSVETYCYYLLIIAGALSEKVGVGKEEFKALAESAFEIGKKSDWN